MTFPPAQPTVEGQGGDGRLASAGFAGSSHPVLQALRGGLVVSCQPVDGGPFDRDDMVLAFARAALQGGAAALRIEGARRVALVRQNLALPVIGIVKRNQADSAVRITPLVADVQALAAAGADVIAVDATQRVRPAAVRELLHAVRDGSALAMADCSCADDALAAQALGFDLIGTTLSGYVGPGPVPPGPDLDLVRQLVGVGLRVMAEGRFNTPEQAREALQAGAWAVTVGSAITRPEWVTGWFVQALSGRQARG